MAFRALHEQWGTVFADLPDLGCGQDCQELFGGRDWRELWRRRPPAPLTCDECGHPMFPKIATTGLRFFEHAPGAPTCALGLESIAHHTLKLDLANATRHAGANAELEARGPEGAWRTDVLASDPAGEWTIALEAPLATVTNAEVIARTERMRAAGVESCWFSDDPRPPWLGVVPSARLVRSASEVYIADGLMWFGDNGWQTIPAITLTQFLNWMFTRRLVMHAPRTATYQEPAPQLFWTTQDYIHAEDRHIAYEERKLRDPDNQPATESPALERRRAERQQKIAERRASALREAAAAEQAARGTPQGVRNHESAARHPDVQKAIAFLAKEYGVAATAGLATGVFGYACGVPLVDGDGLPVAVLDPSPELVLGDALVLLPSLLLLFRSRDQQAEFYTKTSWRMDDYRADHVYGRECFCTPPRLFVKIGRSEYPAEPSRKPSPAAELYAVICRECGRRYVRPWRRTGNTPLPRSDRQTSAEVGPHWLRPWLV